jgi:hypothetical protein
MLSQTDSFPCSLATTSKIGGKWETSGITASSWHPSEEVGDSSNEIVNIIISSRELF